MLQFEDKTERSLYLCLCYAIAFATLGDRNTTDRPKPTWGLEKRYFHSSSTGD
ncbi:MAG TPA: hypothetical protein V6D30_12130 [Leptolyngbyaceae cyanobacterium]